MSVFYLYPKRVVYACGVENGETLLKKKNKQIGIGQEEVAVLSAGASLILDFGKEIVGGARILSWFSQGNIPVRLRFGESVAETCSDPGEKNATNDHALRDFEISLPQLSDGVYGDTGFRFLRIDAEGELKLKSVIAVDHRTPLKATGYFRCNDARVNKIYRTAKDTLFCCVQNGYVWDGVKRDRLVWIGDLHPEMLGLFATAGRVKNVENCLRLAVEQTPLPGWMNTIPSYSLWWIVDLHDFWLFTGDLSLAREYEDYFIALLEQVDAHVDEDGTTRFPYDFLDWPTHEREDELAGQAGFLLYAAQKAVALSKALGKKSKAEDLVRKLRNRKDAVKTFKQAEAMRVLAGAVPAEEGAKLLERGGSRGLSSFMSYYILRALAEGGKGEFALNAMKEFYGGMLDRGAKTFWEDFSVDWLEGSGRIDELPKEGEKDIHGDFGAFCYEGYRHSLCHGWSCGPIAFLTRVVLGVRVLQAGCKKIAICPDLCGLTSAEGAFPTPYGPVKIKHTRLPDGKIKTECDAPSQVEIVTEI